ncbi:MAG: GNAT family N-acetyltransferase [Pyrinomonadaceae bacterium]
MKDLRDQGDAQSNGFRNSGHAVDLQSGKHDLHVRPMLSGEESFVLEALTAKPLHNVIVIGLILDNGLESAKNRGICYACFAEDRLVGVALIGHHVLLSGSPESSEAFADIAVLNHSSEVKVVLGEQPLADVFCHRFEAASGPRVIHSNTDHLLLASFGVECDKDPFVNLRKAFREEAEAIAKINSGAFMELYGINPETMDRNGFRRRILGRVEMGRIWVLTDESGIAFKADVVSATPDAVYLEAIVTRPELRGSGVGTRAFQSLCAKLLMDHKAVCLLADLKNQRAISFYLNIGFTPAAFYRLIRYLD